ncbi:MAG: DinB family protein [Cyclobacteriaceae bacterium]
MKLPFTILILLFGLSITSNGQNDDPSVLTLKWTEEDRNYLLENLIRSKEELIEETQNLTTQQWNFKGSPDRWSINQIVEHIALYELIFMNAISVALQKGPVPNFPHYAPDSLFVDQDPYGLKQNKTTDFTKPFSITVPLGNNEGQDNLTWLLKMRDESIEFIQIDKRNLREYYINFGPNVHQKCMMIFVHTDRHIRQIKKVKAHEKYPK